MASMHDWDESTDLFAHSVIGYAIRMVIFAILPDEDPFGWDERGRMLYVYAVEGCVVLTLMHVRVTMPLTPKWF